MYKKLMIEKKWPEAIQYLQTVIEDKGDQCCDTEYKDLGKCLRFEGDYDKALTILKKGIELFPQSTALYSEMFTLYSVQNKWEDAKCTAETLIELEPEAWEHYYKLGRSYNFLKKPDLASSYFITALEKMHNSKIDDLINGVKQSIDKDPSAIVSRYVFMGGKNNLGSIEHVQAHPKPTKIYLTKIVDAKKKREQLFYTKACEEYPQLKSISPKLISIVQFKHTSFITTEKIIGQKPDKSHLDVVVRGIKKNVSTIKFREGMNDFLNIPNYRLNLKKKRSQSVLHFFSGIHKEATNKRLFMLLKKQLDSTKYSPEIFSLIQRLEHIIMDLELYNKVKPMEHYAFLHGDFGPHNILIEDSTNNPYLLDWNSYTTGPIYFDMANLFVKFNLSFQEIDSLCSKLLNADNEMDNIDKILFFYALLIIWFQSSGRKKLDKAYSKCLLPAIECLEFFALQEVDPEQKKRFLKHKKEQENLAKFRLLKHRFTGFFKTFKGR